MSCIRHLGAETRWLCITMAHVFCLAFVQTGDLVKNPESSIRRLKHQIRDKSGRVFTTDEILNMGFTKYEKTWQGSYRQPLYDYLEVASLDNQNRIRQMRQPKRRLFVRLDNCLRRLDNCVIPVCFDRIGGGTAILASGMRLKCTRAEFIHNLILRSSVGQLRSG